jgi:hypothetical protein
MFHFFRKKKKIPVQQFNFTYRIVYKLYNGKTIVSDPVSISIPASSKVDAERKLEQFVKRKIEVKIV